MKNSIPVEQLVCPDTLPAVAFHTPQMSFAMIYSEFTHDKIRLKESERIDRFMAFLDWFSTVAKKRSMVLGDFNIDWQDQKSPHQQKLLAWSQNHDFSQRVLSPTRIAQQHTGSVSSSIIDLCFVREQRTTVKVVEPYVSDHKAIVVNVSRPKQKLHKKLVNVWKITPVRNQLQECIKDRNILPQNLHGFRSGRSTTSAIIQVNETVKSALLAKKKVMLVAIDAFDLIPREFLKESVKIIGGGPVCQQWLGSYLSERSCYVASGKGRSKPWVSDTGVIQGGPSSPDLYNIGTLSLPAWNKNSESIMYADDDVELVVADTEEECQKLAQEAADKVSEWYRMVGLSLNANKSEIMGFGFEPRPITVGGKNIVPTKTVKFLGCLLQTNMKWDRQVTKLCSQLRQAAGRIRFEGRHMTVQDRKTLYHGWCTGTLLANAGAYLVLLTEGQKKSVQTACNAGIRAVIGLPRWGKFPISCLLYTSPSPRDGLLSRMPSSA